MGFARQPMSATAVQEPSAEQVFEWGHRGVQASFSRSLLSAHYHIAASLHIEPRPRHNSRSQLLFRIVFFRIVVKGARASRFCLFFPCRFGLVLFCTFLFRFVFACVPNIRQYVRLCTHAHSHTFQDRFQASATPPKPNETVHHDSHAHLRGTHKSPAHTRLYAPTLRADTRAAGKTVKQVAEDECTKATLAMQVGLMWLV